MATGLSATSLANKYLDVLGGSTFTGITNVYCKLHTGDPGASGTANASSVTTRPVITWAAASAGSKAANGTLPSWASWAGSNETITHISLWDASSAGNFLWSGALTAAKPVTSGDTLSLSSLSVAISSIAA